MAYNVKLGLGYADGQEEEAGALILEASSRLSQQTHPASYPHHTLPTTLPRHLLLSGSDRRLGSQGGS